MSRTFYGSAGEYCGHGGEDGSFFGSCGCYEGRTDDGDGEAFGIFKGFFG